ncbi:hypothetical protein GCM10010964_04820 [Caldovatus sediminis]|uniref:Uncharacterized protein n=1 Tax=Caldovatus sediminis TaxID=2041189 RepID=A0A8J3EAV5_9PROT|nr:hypothetical protein [Caldovatus sediminis]GGG19632.1 hypothetical protein GCM10010964_04820 [Caldovatus sediminis]
MGVDRYTKAVLTVIAAALCVLAAQNAVTPSQAQLGGAVPAPGAAVQRVAVCDVTGTRCAGIEAGLGRGAAESGGSLRILGEVRTLR